MSNMLKTGLLLAVLTVMLVLIGGAVGGRQGMLIAFFVALAMNFVSYWFSDKMVLAAYGAQPIEEASAPRLYAIVHRLATRAAIQSCAGRATTASARAHASAGTNGRTICQHRNRASKVAPARTSSSARSRVAQPPSVGRSYSWK